MCVAFVSCDVCVYCRGGLVSEGLEVARRFGWLPQVPIVLELRWGPACGALSSLVQQAAHMACGLSSKSCAAGNSCKIIMLLLHGLLQASYDIVFGALCLVLCVW